MTNYERIKNMSVEEMADFIEGIGDSIDGYTKYIGVVEIRSYDWSDDNSEILAWLNSEVEE